MKNTFLPTLALVSMITLNGFSQNVVSDPEVDTFLTQRGITKTLPGVDYTGSAYVNENFQPGTVYRNGEIVASGAALRYNALRDEFEFKDNLNAPNGSARILSKSKDLYVKIRNRLFIFSELTTETAKPGYYEVLHEGEPFSLYRKVRMEYIEGKKAINSISTDILPNFKEQESMYLVEGNSRFIELPNSKNGRIGSFGKNKKVLKKYVKENDLNPKRNSDMSDLVGYYNTLISK